MAIGYSGPRAQTMLLKVTDGVTTGGKNIYLHTIIREVQPMLAAPFILDVIKNTNNSQANQMANARYYYNIKKTPATLITDANDNTAAVVNDPTTLLSEDINLEVRQLAPVEYGKKLRGSFRDLMETGLENAASVAIADFIVQRRLTKQQEAFNMCLSAAQAVQTKVVAADSTATTWQAGAHLVKTTYADSESIYNDLRIAVSSFKRLGQDNAYTNFNKTIDYVMGIQPSDMLILISDDAAGLLLGKSGLYASDSGNELFKKLNLKEFLGVPMLITSTLPAGVNWMIITTGRAGTIGYEEVGNVALKAISGKEIPVLQGEAVMVNDPNWSQYYRIDISDIYKLGVIFDELVFASVTPNTTITKSGQQAKKSEQQAENN